MRATIELERRLKGALESRAEWERRAPPLEAACADRAAAVAELEPSLAAVAAALEAAAAALPPLEAPPPAAPPALAAVLALKTQLNRAADSLKAAAAAPAELSERFGDEAAAAAAWAAEVAAGTWAAGDAAAARAAHELQPTLHAALAPIASRAGALRAALDDAPLPKEEEWAARVAPLKAALADARARVGRAEEAARAAARPAAPRPRGSRELPKRALTAAEQQRVDEWLAPGGGAPTEELAELNNVPVSRRDIATLRPGEWLNDEVINFYMELLKQRASADMSLGDGKRFPKCHIFCTMFYPKLMQNATFDYSRVRRWTMAKKMAHGDVFGMDLVLVPIHCNGNHWTLAVINFVDKRFEYHDSLRGSGRHVIKNLRDWLRKESADKRKCEWEGWEEIAGHPNDGEWRNGWSEKEWERGIPQQRNGFDCGVFMCKNADYHARDGLLNFTQADIDYFRRRIVLEIRNCQLVDDDPPPGAA